MRRNVFLILLPLFLVCTLEAIEERYQLVDLGLLGYQSSQATSLNNHNQVCGTFIDKGKSYTFIWNPSHPHFNYSNIQTSVKPLINNASEIFGCQLLPTTNDVWDYEQESIFCWTHPLNFFTFFNTSNLGCPKEAAKNSPFDQKRTVLWDVNDQGELIVMNSDSLKHFFLDRKAEFQYQVWVYYKGAYKLISHPQFSVGFSLNNQSQVLGCYYQNENPCLSIYDMKTGHVYPLTCPSNAIGKAINDVGKIIGVFHHPLTHKTHGFLTDASGNCINLGHFYPIKHNNQNVIVGKFLSGEKKEKPAIWENGQMYDVLELVHLVDDKGQVWDSLDELVDVNDQGFIIGQGKFKGMTQGFLLQPVR